MTFSGATFTLPDTRGLAFFGIPFSTSGVRLHVSADEFTVEGTLALPAVLGGTSVYAQVAITNDDGGPPEVAVVGSLQVDGPIVLGPGFSLEHLLLQVDTAESEVRGGATLYVPAGLGITGSVGIKAGYFDYVSAGVVHFQKCILYGPPPAVVPIVYLQDLTGSLDHLAPDSVDHRPVVLGGAMSFTAGPEIHWGSERYSLLRLDLSAEWDTAGWVRGSGEVILGGGAFQFELASAEAAIGKDYGLYVHGMMSFLDLLRAETALHLDLGNTLEGTGEGRISVPGRVPFFGGRELLGAKVHVQYIDDGINENDYVEAGTKVWPLSFAVRIPLHLSSLSEIDWLANYETLQQVEVPPPPNMGMAAAVGLVPLAASVPYEFDLPVGIESAVFSIRWDQGDTAIHLTDPFGVTYTPDNVGGSESVYYGKDVDGKQAAFLVLNPAGGTWRVTVTEAEGIGGYRLESRRSTNAPVITLREPQHDTGGGPVTITWTDEDSDSDATISLYYDTDREGADGVLIATGISQDSDPDSYVWDTAGVPTGEYYVYAVIDDGSNVPAITYSTGRVSVVEAGAPGLVTGLTAWAGTETTARLAWDAVEGAEYYLLRLTGDAAGEFYGRTVAAVESETLIDGLTSGETYRASVAAVDGDGRVGPSSTPILVVAGGTAAVPPAEGQWEVFARPGALYQGQVPGSAGDAFTLVAGPAGATLDAEGLFAWNVPVGADGWYEVLVHVTDTEGNITVHRFWLLADGSDPEFAEGQVRVEAVSESSLRVEAPRGRDVSGVLQYRLDRDGQIVSDWQTSPVFEDTGLQPNTAYEYRVQVRDASPDGRVSPWSASASGRALTAVPGSVFFGEVTATSVGIAGLADDGNPAGTEYAIYNATTRTYVASDGSGSAVAIWQPGNPWVDVTLTGLESHTAYIFQAAARNADGIETGWGPAAAVRTAREAEPPQVQTANVMNLAGDVQLCFSEPVAISLKDVAVTDGSGTPLSLSGAALEHALGSAEAVIRFNGILPNGPRTVRLKGANVQDLSGNLLDGNGDGTGGDDFSLLLTVVVSQEWTGATDNEWNNGSNWSAGAVPDATCATEFSAGGPNQPVLSQGQSAKGLDLQTDGWTIGGSGHTLTIGSDGVDSAGSGTNTIVPVVALSADSTWTVGADNTLSLDGVLNGGGNTLTKDGAGTLVLNGGQDRTTGLALSVDSGSVSMEEGYGPLFLTDLSINSGNATLDLADNAMIIDYDDPAASPLEDVKRWIASGCNGRLWDGDGIVSTVAAGSPATFGLGYAQNDLLFNRFSTFAGQDVDLTTVLVKYTYLGDVNLDGKVDDNDVVIMVLNYDRGLSSTHTWQEGDVSRYDGKIDDNDITALVLNYGAGWKPGMGGPLGGAPGAASLPTAAPEVLMTPDAIPSVPLVEEADLLVSQATRARQTALGSAQAAGGAKTAPTTALARSGAYQGSAFLPVSGTSAADDPPLVFLAAASTPLAWSTAEEVAPTADAALPADGAVEDLLLLPALEITPM